MINYYLQQEQEQREKQHEEEYLDWQTELAEKREKLFAEGKFDALCYGEPRRRKVRRQGCLLARILPGYVRAFCAAFRSRFNQILEKTTAAIFSLCISHSF